MSINLTGCCIQLCANVADRLDMQSPLPAVRSDDHALPVESSGQSQRSSPEVSPLRHINGNAANVHGGKTGGGEAAAAPSTASNRGRGSLRKLPAVLRVEVASKLSAQVLSWSVLAINMLFVWLAIVLLSLRQSEQWTAGQLRPYYAAEIIIGAVGLSVLLLAAAWFGLSVWRSNREERVWSKRQRYFAGTAAVLLVLQTGYSSAFVASYGFVLAADNCSYPFTTLSILEFVQWVFFVSTLLFLLARLHSVMVYRGPGALDMHPDFRLVVDRPLLERPRQNKWILAAWLVLVSLGVLNMVDKFKRYSKMFPNPSCDAQLSKLQCPPNTIQIASASVYLAVILLFVAYWLYSLYRATRDHELLPWHKYRATLIFIHIQARIFGPVISAVVLSTLFLGLIPAFSNSCWAAIDAQIGNLPVDLALSLAAVITSLLYVPKAHALDSPMLQDFFQVFAWTEAGVEKQLEQRNRHLLDSRGSGGSGSGGRPEQLRQLSFVQAMDAVESAAAYLPGKLARLAGVPNGEAAVEKLREEPCFCMETAVRLFYWMRLAYREDDVLDHRFVNAAGGLELFDLQHFETIWDESTDTHCVVGWSNSTCVIAFRGTQTIQNVLTDLKVWMAPLQPETQHKGRLCKVHAGFLSAWQHDGFCDKVLARLRELDSGPQPLRFWICGHSLGGALAALAALQIRQRHPASQLTVLTYGCPRVGNRAFSDLFDQMVPDCWAIVNDLDPIPWVPKWCFHRVGRRVIIDGRGNLILQPSYFEIAVTHRGASAKHHLTGSYAMSLAAIFRAQFVPSKALPGGAHGMAALQAAVDLSKALQLTNMDLDSLRDPGKLPELAEAVAARQAAQKRSRAGNGRRRSSRCSSCGNASLLPACCDSRLAVVGGHEERRASGINGMAAEGMEAPQRAWWCCSAGAALKRAAAAASSNDSRAEMQQQQQRRQVGEGQGELPDACSTLPPPTAAASAGTEAVAAGAAADKGLRKHHSSVHVKRFNSLSLHSSRLSAGVSRAGRAATAEAAAGEQAVAAGSDGATVALADSGPEQLSLHSALSYPDSMLLDDSGSWVVLAAGSGSSIPGRGRDAGSGPSRRSMLGRRHSLRYSRN